MKKKHLGFTLIEILIVVMIVGIMMTMLIFRMQGLDTHAQLSLVAEQWEDAWQRTTLKMRQGRIHDEAKLKLTNQGVEVAFSGGISGDAQEIIQFAQPIEVSVSGQNAIWTIESYAISCRVGENTAARSRQSNNDSINNRATQATQIISATDSVTQMQQQKIILSLGKMKTCYSFDATICNMKRVVCD